MRFFVVPPTCHAGKAYGDSRFVALGELNTIECEFKHELGLDCMDRTKSFEGISPDEAIDLMNLFIGKA